MTPDMQGIVQRLEEMEKQVAHLQALITEQSDPDRAVVARSFVVKDPEGKQRAALGLHEGCSGLWLYDANGNPRAGLTVLAKEGPSLALRDTDGRASVDICVDENGPTIRLFDANGKQEALVTPKALLLFDAQGKARVKIGMSHEDEFSLGNEPLQSPSGGANWPTLALLDEDGRGGNLFVLTPTGPALRLQDRRGNVVLLTVKYDTGEASVSIGSRDGKVVWSAP